MFVFVYFGQCSHSYNWYLYLCLCLYLYIRHCSHSYNWYLYLRLCLYLYFVDNVRIPTFGICICVCVGVYICILWKMFALLRLTFVFASEDNVCSALLKLYIYLTNLKCFIVVEFGNLPLTWKPDAGCSWKPGLSSDLYMTVLFCFEIIAITDIVKIISTVKWS